LNRRGGRQNYQYLKFCPFRGGGAPQWGEFFRGLPIWPQNPPKSRSRKSLLAKPPSEPKNFRQNDTSDFQGLMFLPAHEALSRAVPIPGMLAGQPIFRNPPQLPVPGTATRSSYPFNFAPNTSNPAPLIRPSYTAHMDIDSAYAAKSPHNAQKLSPVACSNCLRI
jgi:hypothetical protein